MSILQRFMCATTTAGTIRKTIGLCKVREESLNLLSRWNISTNQTVSNKSTQSSIKNDKKKADWAVVYRLPIVRWAAAFNRLKVYQSALTVAGIPGAFILEKSEVLSVGASTIVGAIGVSGIITLALCSLIVKNLIGFIYINRETNQLKLAYVDYWGRRQDIVVSINDLVPDGAQEKPTRANFYQRISLQSNEKLSFKLLQRYGIIVQPDVFNELFY